MESNDRGRIGYGRGCGRGRGPGRGRGGCGRGQGYRGRGNYSNYTEKSQEFIQDGFGSPNAFQGDQRQERGRGHVNRGRSNVHIRPNIPAEKESFRRLHENRQEQGQSMREMTNNLQYQQTSSSSDVRFQHAPVSMPMKFPPAQMYPMSMWMGEQEIEVTYKIKRGGQSDLDPRQGPTPYLQQTYQQQNVIDQHHIANPMTQNMNRSQSLMSVKNPVPNVFPGSKRNENKKSGVHTMTRSSSVQNIGNQNQNMGARPKEYTAQKCREEHFSSRCEQRMVHAENVEQRYSAGRRGESSADNRELLDSRKSCNTEDTFANNELFNDKRTGRGRGGRRGMYPRVTHKTGTVKWREEGNEDSAEKDKERRNTSEHTDLRRKMHPRGNWRGRRMDRLKMYQRDTPPVEEKSDDETHEIETYRNKAAEEDIENANQYSTSCTPMRGRGHGFGSVRLGRGRLKYVRRNNNMHVKREELSRSSSESSLASCESTTSAASESPFNPSSVNSDPARAGTEGVETTSIQTLKNRLKRYKRKLNELKRREAPDSKTVLDLQNDISDIDRAVQKRTLEEKEGKTKDACDHLHTQEGLNEEEQKEKIKTRDTSISSGDDTSKILHKHRSTILQNKHKGATFSKKMNISFRPKRKPRTSLQNARGTEKISSSDEDDEDDTFLEIKMKDEDSEPVDDETGRKAHFASVRTRKHKNKRASLQKKTVKQSADTEDWKEKLEELCLSDADEKQSCSVNWSIHTDVKSMTPEKTSADRSKVSANDKTEEKLDKESRRENNSKKQAESTKKFGAHRNENHNVYPRSDDDKNDGHRNTEKDYRRHRSESIISDSSVHAGPDEVEVFKFLVKEWNGESRPTDIKETCSLFKDHDDVDAWFRSHSRKFSYFEKENKIIKVCVFVKDASYCLDYITQKGCKKSACPRYHFCKNVLCGYCKFGDHCKFSHNTLDEHNLPISSQLGFSDLFDNKQIVHILSLRFPHVCEMWNKTETGDCQDIVCTKLHICKRQIFGNCLKRDSCPFEHSLTTDQNQMVTKAYKMQNWNPKIFNKLLFAIKGQTDQVKGNVEELLASDELDDRVPENKAKTGMSGGPEGVKDHLDRTRIHQLHTRPARKKDHSKKQDDSYLSEDHDSGKKYLCEKQLIGYCEAVDCPNYHHAGKTAGLPFIWQLKIYGNWICLPEGQGAMIEASFCSYRDEADSNIMVSEDGLYQEYTIYFHPEIYAYIKYLDIDGEQMKTDARRLTTPSYVDGNLEELSFKTQWRWYWVDDGGNPQPFDTADFQFTLEKKYVSGQKTYLYSRDNYRFKYCLDFASMTQVNLDTGKIRKIFRRPIIVEKDDILQRKFPTPLKPSSTVSVALPEGWMAWDLAHPFELVELEQNQNSYAKVEAHFYKTLDRNSFMIDQIYRVQNPKLWSAYKDYKNNMETDNEYMLFHGTDSLDTVRGIAINNFDHRISGKNATMYGKGAYFAKTAKYSHAYTNPPDRFMFLAKVLVGEYTLGEKSLNRPPSKPGAAHELYDSCVNNLTNPSIYVVFDTKQYYPEFLIQYHSTAVSSDFDNINLPVPNQLASNNTAPTYPRSLLQSPSGFSSSSYPSAASTYYPNNPSSSYPSGSSTSYPISSSTSYPSSPSTSYPSASGTSYPSPSNMSGPSSSDAHYSASRTDRAVLDQRSNAIAFQQREKDKNTCVIQ